MYRNVTEVKELYGLTDLEAEILDLLTHNHNGLTAKEVIMSFPNRGENVYRPLDRLVGLGIVDKSNDWPKRYVTKNLRKNKKSTILTFPYADDRTNIFERVRDSIRRFLRSFRK